jgi:hypothetical protein
VSAKCPATPSTHLQLVLAFYIRGLFTKSFRTSLDEAWLRLGITAMVAFSILVIVSLRPIRTEAYEVFFYTHFFAVL